jgi:hypothetical protein
MSLVALSSVIAPRPQAAVDVSFGFVYSNLQPHGSWLVSAQYGRVWQPREYRPGWNPYYDGHWVYADVGWTWVSDYSWGAVPYHYGTWTLDPVYGWVWVPGMTWAPAWVVFRTGPDCIGWAPVAPGFSVGVSFGASSPVSGSFLFVSNRDFAAPRIRSYVIPEARANVLVRQTTIVNNLTVQNNIVVNRGGPSVRTIERASGRTFRAMPVETVARVAPFAGVSRSQLTVAPGRSTHGVPAAEMISAKRPLPSSGERASTTQPTAPERRRFGSEGTVQPSQPAPREFGPSHGGPRRIEPSQPTEPTQPRATEPSHGGPRRLEPSQPSQPSRLRVTEPSHAAPSRPEPQQQAAPRTPEPSKAAPKPSTKRPAKPEQKPPKKEGDQGGGNQ